MIKIIKVKEIEVTSALARNSVTAKRIARNFGTVSINVAS
jgi:hypothetical protein